MMALVLVGAGGTSGLLYFRTNQAAEESRRTELYKDHLDKIVHTLENWSQSNFTMRDSRSEAVLEFVGAHRTFVDEWSLSMTDSLSNAWFDWIFDYLSIFEKSLEEIQRGFENDTKRYQSILESIPSEDPYITNLVDKITKHFGHWIAYSRANHDVDIDWVDAMWQDIFLETSSAEYDFMRTRSIDRHQVDELYSKSEESFNEVCGLLKDNSAEVTAIDRDIRSFCGY
jgi:hypothetical protein